MPKKQLQNPNPDWATELAAYDKDCEAREREFIEHHIVFGGSPGHGLTEEETTIFTMFLRGVSCAEIAKEAGVTEGEIVGFIEVIRAKLAIEG